MRWLILLTVASCGRGPATDECGEPGRGELLAASFEDGEQTVAITGDWTRVNGTDARHGRAWALLWEGQQGTLRTVEPVQPRGRHVSLGFWLRNFTNAYAGPITVRASVDNETFFDGTAPPSMDRERQSWSYGEVAFVLASEAPDVWFEIAAEDPQLYGSSTGWLAVDAITAIDPQACERDRVFGQLDPGCVAGDRVGRYWSSFELGTDDTATFSGAFVRWLAQSAAYSGEYVAQLGAESGTAAGTLRSAPLSVEGGTLSVRFWLMHDNFQSASVSARASGDSGVTFGAPVLLDADLTLYRDQWSRMEILVPAPAGAGVVVELAATVTAAAPSTLWVDGFGVDQITLCP